MLYVGKQKSVDSSEFPAYDTDKSAAPTIDANVSSPFTLLSATAWAPANQKVAAWPTFENQHVRGDRDVVSLTKTKTPFTSSTLHRKKKTREIHVPPNDNILCRLDIDVLTQLSLCETLQLPTRHVLNCHAVLQLAQNHVNLAGNSYLQYLYKERLPKPTAFDKSEYEDRLWSSSYAPICAEHIAVSDDSALIFRKWLHIRMEYADRSKTHTISKRRMIEREKSKLNDLEGFICFSDSESAALDYEIDPISSDEEDYRTDKSEEHANTDTGSSIPVSTSNDLLVESEVTEDDSDTGIISAGFKRRRRRRSKRRKYSNKGQKQCSRLRAKQNRPSRNSNVIILCGPPSSFKTSTVYASAKELNYFVFEINAGQRRNGKEILDQVGEMSQSNLVHRKVVRDGESFEETDSLSGSSSQSDNQSFSHQRSFLLLEDVDVVFECDKSFWPTLIKFIETSKRPVVLTCTDERYIPTDLLESNPGCLLQFRHSRVDLLVDIAWSIALSEGHLLRKPDVRATIQNANCDLRQSLAILQFWCQMAIGDDRKGLNWVLERSSQIDMNEHRKMRVISENTFREDLLRFNFGTEDFSNTYGQTDDVSTDEGGIEPVRLGNFDSSALQSDVALLSSGYDLMSAVDIWDSHSHTLLEVPMVSII